tara:strand:- start:115909 stop:116310 length:402 start_codon:yes stop_codon:yes gene_type:complete
MTWQPHDYDAIEGTYVFDGQRSSSGYALNKMAYSFNDAANREEFARDMEAYCRKYKLPDDAREAVLAGDFLTLLRLGGNIYYLAKIAIFHGLSVQDVGAQMSAISTQDFQQRLHDNAGDVRQTLARRGGFFDG